MQRFETRAHFTCPKCGKASLSTVEVPEPNWGEAESATDLMSDGPTEVVCPHCKEEFSAYAYNNAGNCQITLDNFPDVRICADIAMFEPPEEDWLNWDFPHSPHSVFHDTCKEVLDLLSSSGSDDCSGLAGGSPLINRMVFAQLISALEAYLGDTLMKALTAEADGMAKLINADRDLNEQKFSLAEIASRPNLVHERVSHYLRETIIYHNLQKVHFLYSTALGVSVLGNRASNARLLEAIKLRHDCVHRNGKAKDGSPIREFTRIYVEEVADTIKCLVDRLQKEVWGEHLWGEIPF